MNPQIFGKAALPPSERETIDDIVARTRDPRTPVDIARDDAKRTISNALEGARHHVEWIRTNVTGSSRARALAIAEKKLADSERAARAAGVPL